MNELDEQNTEALARLNVARLADKKAKEKELDTMGIWYPKEEVKLPPIIHYDILEF